jgi:hypothetical protein
VRAVPGRIVTDGARARGERTGDAGRARGERTGDAGRARGERTGDAGVRAVPAGSSPTGRGRDESRTDDAVRDR